MPNLVMPNEGLCDLLDYMLRRAISGVLDLQLVLWLNDIEPDQLTVLGDLLTPVALPGYSPVTLTRSAWTPAAIIDDRAVSTWGTTPILWTIGAYPQTVYGYAIVDVVLGVIRFVQRFDVPVDLSLGIILGVLPRVTLTSDTCSP